MFTRQSKNSDKDKNIEPAYHYLGLEDDEYRIIYNIDHINRYIWDWQSGIATAEDFIIRAIKEDIYKFVSILRDPHPEKLLDLVLKHQTNLDKDKLLLAIQLKKQFISSSFEQGKIFQTIHEKNVMAYIFGDEYLQRYGLQLFLYFDFPIDTLLDFCAQIRSSMIPEVALHLYKVALVCRENPNNIILGLKKLNEQQASNKGQQQPAEGPEINTVIGKTVIITG